MTYIFITGGTKRIGLYIAKAMAAKGYNLILHDHHADKAQRALCHKALCEYDISFDYVSADFLKGDETHSMLKDMFAHYGVPTGFIHTASLFEPDHLKDYTAQSWRDHMRIHNDIPVEIIQKMLPFASKTHLLSAILLIDQRVYHPSPDFFSYTASKMLMKELVPLLSISSAPFMRVNGIAPGATLKSKRQSESDFKAQCATTPLNKGVPPEEIAQTALYLTQASSVTGQIMTLDSGQSMDWRLKTYGTIKE